MLDWEENVFLGLKSLHERLRVRPRERRRRERCATLKEEREALFLLANMLAARPVSLFETDNPVLCSENRIFLPPEFDLADTPAKNAELYRVKTIIAALAIRENLQSSATPVRECLSALRDEFPGLEVKIRDVRECIDPAIDLWQVFGEIPKRNADLSDSSALLTPEDALDDSQTTTEIEGRGQTDVEVIDDTGDDGEGADLPTHTFEKTETLEEQTGLSRKSDADDELEDHEEALKEVNMTQVLRSPDRPRSIYRSDIILDGMSLEVATEEGGSGIPYPEWDYKRGEYRMDWCYVREERDPEHDLEWVRQTEARHQGLIRDLKRRFAAIMSEWLKLKQQPIGTEFDIDAVIDGQVRLRAGQTPSENVYLNRRRDLHDISAMLLLDLSYSTDAYLDNSRVLDTIRDTVFCVGEVLEDYIESFAVAGFSSNTRRACRFSLIKTFEERWHDARSALGALKPEGYTRIGPALRHAQELLMQTTARRKIVILVTDGRPCDYDRYEGLYGIHDVKMAIETGHQHMLATHAFAIEKQAADYFPKMFTGHHFDIVKTPDRLSQTMCGLFARLIAD